MKNFFLSVVLITFTNSVLSHDDNEARIKFWKEYYNPKVEVTSRSVPKNQYITYKK